MMENDERHPGQANSRGVAKRAAVLIASLVLVSLLVGPLSFYFDGVNGLVASGAGMTICLVCGLLALVVAEQFRKPEHVLQQVLITMGLRMGIPLGLCMVVYIQRGPLAEAGMVYYLLVFYLVTLLVETMMATGGQRHTELTTSGSTKAS